ncbi:AAA family ATPase [Sedimentitalea sp. XS_ASV28]|uniref:AAA family ATPase n=1 Tax=Sedimentitalea sp. XS_ASV28 TaxID=3241296 RepID=UPI00351291E9
MYETFFDLKTLPFKITPDPAFIYWDVAHKRAASVLAFGIEQLVPITVITGDVGTGKTTLLQNFLEEAPRETTVGMLSNFWSGMGGLYQWILNAFDIKAEGSTVQQYRAFEDFAIAEYAAGRRCVLIVDEAQNISDEDLEQLRMLTNINARKDCLVMLFLVGQPELRDRLKQPNNRQIAQRVGAAFHLGPLSEEDTGHYIRHRISVAGGTRELFDDAAIDRIYGVTGGVPRLINVVCELALVTAFGDGVEHIDGDFMEEFLSEAAETGLIAHLPTTPVQPTGGGMAAQTVKRPGGPAGSSGFRQSASLGSGKPSIRLVSDPWDTKETVEAPEADTDLPAARHVQPPVHDPLPDADQPGPEPATARPTGANDEEALGLASPEPLQIAEPQDTRGREARVQDTVPQPETEPESQEDVGAGVAAAMREPPAPRQHEPFRLLGLGVRILDDGFNVALVVLVIAAVFGAGAWYMRDAARDARAVQDTAGVATMTDAPTDAPAEQVGNAPLETVTAVQPEETPDPVEEARAPASDGVAPLDDPTGDALLETAISASYTDPFSAVIDYSRAALRGEGQAAYYLGQMFETGLDVPRDAAVARAWYQRAEPDVRSAKRRLANLDVPESVGVLAAPMPLLGGPLPDGSAEFVWSGGVGAAPEYFLVEMAAAPDAPVVRLGQTRLTAAATPDYDGERVWRVLAIRPASSDYRASNWFTMGPEAGPVTNETAPARPSVSLSSVEGVAGDLLEAAAALLGDAGFPIVLGAKVPSSVQGGTVSYAYEADRAAAEQVAALLSGDIALAEIPARSSDDTLILPGQIMVLLD